MVSKIPDWVQIKSQPLANKILGLADKTSFAGADFTLPTCNKIYPVISVLPKYFYQKFGQRTEKKTSWGAFSKLTDKEKIYLKTNLFSNLFIYLSFILYKYWRNKDLHVSKSFYPAELNDSAITQLNDRNQPIQHFFVVNKLFPILFFWVTSNLPFVICKN